MNDSEEFMNGKRMSLSEMWKNRIVLVTGGASFISSHLVDTILRKGAAVRVADDFSSGKLGNLE